MFLATPDAITQQAVPLDEIVSVADFLVNSTDVSEAELAELREEFKRVHYPTLQNLDNPYDLLYFKDGTIDENGL